MTLLVPTCTVANAALAPPTPLSSIGILHLQSAVTFYNDRDQYLQALGSANIVEATASRTKTNFWAENIRIQETDFEQCGLAFSWGGETDHMSYIQMRFGDHEGDRNVNGDKAFGGEAVYWVWLKKTTHDGTTVKTDYPFYAMGFDVAGAGSPLFGIKIFGEDVAYYNMPSAHLGEQSQFVGWISDGEPMSEFELIANPDRERIIAMAFTNVAYATTEDVS